MDKSSKLTLSLAGALMAVLLLGLTPNANRMSDSRLMDGAEGGDVFVTGTEYKAVVQERTGYAFGLGHFVGQHHALKHELKGWQDMVRELSHMSGPNTVVDRLHGATQERLGYTVATDHLLDIKAGLGQELMGYQTVLADTVDRNRGLEQEQIGLRYMLDRQLQGS